MAGHRSLPCVDYVNLSALPAIHALGFQHRLMFDPLVVDALAATDGDRHSRDRDQRRRQPDEDRRGRRLSRPQRAEGQNFKVFVAGQKCGLTAAIKRAFRRRSAVEPVIGHLKNEHRMNQNHLAGSRGDSANAVLAAAATISGCCSSGSAFCVPGSARRSPTLQRRNHRISPRERVLHGRPLHHARNADAGRRRH